MIARFDFPKSVIADNVTVRERIRPLDAVKVEELAKSIEEIGLLSPIVVRHVDDDMILVAGHHRLAAVKRLGREHIDAVYVNCDDLTARMIEIAENLHRAELTAIERAEQVAGFARLAREKQENEAKLKSEKRGDEVLAQVAPKLSLRGRKGEGRPEGGARAVARDLGLTREEVRRSEAIAGIAPEAKVAAVRAGLGDNQSALLKVASAPAESQVEAVEAIQARKSEPGPAAKNKATAKTSKTKPTLDSVVDFFLVHFPRPRIPTLLTYLEAVPTPVLVAAIRTRMKNGAAARPGSTAPQSGEAAP